MSAGSHVPSITASLVHGRRTRIRPVQASDNEATVFSVTAFFTICLMAGVSALMLVLVIIQALLYPDGYPDPFTPYAAILPGNPTTVVTGQYSCDRELLAPVFQQEPVFEVSGQSSCAINANSDSFDRIIVTSRNGEIRDVQFLAPKLQAIELVRRWGRPNRIQQAHHNYILTWDVGIVARAPAGGQFSYLLPVRSVLLRPGT
jgi:hypothetical protein